MKTDHIADDGELYFPDRRTMPNEFKKHLEEIVFKFGKSYDSYNVLEAKFHCFFSANHRGVIGFHPTRFGYHVIGGLLADDPDKPALLDAFCRFCSDRGNKPLFYNIGEDDLALLRSRKFEITKWGEDPIIDLQATDWRGKRYEWVRRQENYGKRNNVVVREIEVGKDKNWPTMRTELEALSDGHIGRTTQGREMGLFVSSLDLDNFCRRRLFVAETDAVLQGFVVCNPCNSGRRWAFEIFRHTEHAPRGTVPFIFMQTMRILKAEGAEDVSLSLIPALNCDQQNENHSWYFKWILDLCWNRLNWLFDFRGLYHFKSRFRPKYQARYVAASPYFGFFQVLSLTFMWGLLNAKPTTLSRNIGRKIHNHRRRQTLAKPS